MSAPAPHGPTFGVVIPTIGRDHRLPALFDSLQRQPLTIAKVVVVDQSDGAEVAELVSRWQDQLPLALVRSSPGASRARNRGCAELLWADVIAFADDDVAYAGDAFARARDALARGYSCVSGRLTDAEGVTSRLAFASVATELDPRNVWSHSIESTLFVTTHLLRDVGGFDERLGVGASTPWQSGEGTDLLLRGLARGHRMLFDPSIAVAEVPDVGRDPRAARARARAYARGTGAVYRRHYRWPAWVRASAGPLVRAAAALARGRAGEARQALAVAVGRAQGLWGAGLGAEPQEPLRRGT